MSQREGYNVMADVPGAGELEPAAVETLQDGMQIVLFRAGGALFAVPAANVEQAKRGGDETELTVDFTAEMRIPGGGDLLLVILAGGARLGLRVDEVLEVATLPLSDIYALPRLAAAQQRGGYVSGIGRRNGELVVLLDPVALARMAGARAVGAMAAPPRQ